MKGKKMDEIAIVVKKSKRLESLLKTHYHAEGKGLHSLVSSIEERLPHDVINKLRFIATIRNKTVHEDGYKVEDMKRFLLVCKACEKELLPRSHRVIWGMTLFLILSVTVFAIWFYIQYWSLIIGD